MKQCRHRFAFVDVVSDIKDKLLQLVDSDQHLTGSSSDAPDANRRISRTPNARPESWLGFVRTQRQLYFKLSFSLDFALSKGKYPSENELPSWIVNISPPQVLAEVELSSRAGCIFTISPRESLVRGRSLMHETVFEQSQQFDPDESTFLFPYTALQGSPTGNEGGFICDGQGETAGYNENSDDGDYFSLDMLSYFSEMPVIGG